MAVLQRFLKSCSAKIWKWLSAEDLKVVENFFEHQRCFGGSHSTKIPRKFSLHKTYLCTCFSHTRERWNVPSLQTFYKTFLINMWFCGRVPSSINNISISLSIIFHKCCGFGFASVLVWLWGCFPMGASARAFLQPWRGLCGTCVLR